MGLQAISWIYDHHWAITQLALETIIQIAERDRGDILAGNTSGLDTNALSTKLGQPLQGSYRTEVRDGVAIIPVVGPIFPRANVFTNISGATSLQILSMDLRAALENRDVKGILFNFDSPGGEVTGVDEFANQVAEGTKIKPIVGYGYGKIASAAYWIASAMSKIIVSETAQAGSIGVIAAIKDTRGKDAAAGVKTLEFVSSVSPNKRVNLGSDESLARVQTLIDTLGGVMVQSISRFRGTDVETVLAEYGQGDIFTGTVAYGRGLVDGIGSFESVLSEMASSKSNQTRGGLSMDLNTFRAQHPDLYAEVVALGKKEAETAMAGKLTEARAEGAKVERERIQKISAIKVPGSEKIVAEKMFDATATAESVAIAILHDQQTKAEQQAGAIGADAAALAKKNAQIASGQQPEGEKGAAEDEQILAAMVEGVNSGKVSKVKTAA